MSTKGDKVEPASEELLLPHERGMQSLDSVRESLLGTLESEGFDAFDLEDDPDPDEPASDEDVDSSEDEEDADESGGSEEAESDEDADSSEDEEDADESEDEESDESDDDSTDVDSDEEALFEVTLPGGEKAQVTLDELSAGYSRQADYTRKRQRDATEHSEAMSHIREVREQYDARLAKLGEVLKDSGPAKPGAELRASDSGEYAAQLAEYTEYQSQLDQVSAERTRVDGERQNEVAEWERQSIAEHEEALYVAVPEWRSDVSLAKREVAELRDFAQSELGFTKEATDAVYDHRLILMLREIKTNREGTAKSRKKIEVKKKKTPRLKPGSSKKRPVRKVQKKAVERANKRLAQTGSVRDAARAIELELD